jgi:hypothetical protein
MGSIKVVKRPIPCQAFIIRISTPEAVMANQQMQAINPTHLGLGVLVGAILALSGCKPQAKEAATTAAAPATGNQIAINLPPVPNTLPVPPNPPGNMPIVPLKALEPIQPGPGRLSQPLKTSTRDPFSTVLPSQMEQPLQAIAPKPIITKLSNKVKAILQPKPAKIAAAPVKSKPAIQPKIATKPATKPQPPATISVMPQVNIAPMPAPPVMMPSQAPVATVAPPVVSLVDQVEITGVAQVGNQLLVVARGPGESSARTLAPGSYLSSGRILVKAVRQEGKDPVVVLVENGVETVRSVSGARAMSMR